MPSRRRARARVKDKKYHHPRARIARAPIACASPLAITPSATDDVASHRLASQSSSSSSRE
jgi:hypothetical protein